MRFLNHNSLWPLLFILPISLIWLSYDYLGLLSLFEYTTLDWRFKVRGEMDSPIKLVYVDVDSDALNFMGEKPIPRTFFADAIDSLFKDGKAKIIGMDLLFSDTAYSSLVDMNRIKQDTSNLKNVVVEYPNLVFAAEYSEKPEERLPVPEFPYIYQGYTDPGKDFILEQPDPAVIPKTGIHFGLVNAADSYSPGAITRWVPLFSYDEGKTYLHMALEMARLALNKPTDSIVISEDKISFLNIPLTDKQLVEVNWFSQWNSPKNIRFSLKNVIEARSLLTNGSKIEQEKANAFFKNFNNAFVLIGDVDPILKDLVPTPFDDVPVPRVGIIGNLLKTIFSGKFLERPPFEVNVCLTLFLSAVVVLLNVNSEKKTYAAKILSLLVILIYGFLTFYLFDLLDWVLPFITPIGAALTTAFFVILYQLVRMEKQRSEIKKMFGTYVSRELVEIMAEGQPPQLGGEEKQITALFSDIENFTRISETLSPTKLIELMNEYLFEMTHIIQEEKGTLDKYVGDAIVSMFGAPVLIEDHAHAACRTACRMQNKQNELLDAWCKRSPPLPATVFEMRTRVGINTGLATVGNVGSSIRFNYTMLGADVNLAQRCEAIAKTYGANIITTDFTQKMVASKKEIAFRKLDNVLFHGKSTPVTIYEIIGFKDTLNKNTIQCLQLFEEALDFYFKGKFDKARNLFEKSAAFEPNSKKTTNPSNVFIARCLQMKNN